MRALVLLLVALAAARADAAPRESFLRGPRIGEVSLAPDGASVLVREEARLWRMGMADRKRTLVWSDAEHAEVMWARDSRAVFALDGPRLVAIDLDRGTPRVLRVLERRRGERVLGVDPSRARGVLVVAAAPSGFELLRLDDRGGQERLRADRRPILDAVVDRRGRLASLVVREPDGTKAILRGDGSLVRRCGSVAVCRLLGVDGETGALWLAARFEGDLERLVRLDGDVAETRSIDPRGEVDLDDVILDGEGRPRLALYDGRLVGLDPEMAAAVERLGSLIVRGVSVGPRGTPWLVTSIDPRWRDARFELFWPERGAREVLFAPEGPPQAEPIEIRYTASDGRALQGYLTRPVGRDAARAPLVVQVHGGPWNRVRLRWSPITQFLADRGYAVFEPNFRGSTGFGAAHVLASNGDFGHGRVLADIMEGIDAIHARGVGDPERVAIVGHSFGGYAALLAATHHPERFRVAVAASPPTDFGWLLRWSLDNDDPAADEPPRTVQFREVGLAIDDGAWWARLSREAPPASPDRIACPVWILAGGSDERIPLRSVTRYVAGLVVAGKPVHLLVDEEAGHVPTTPLAREAMLWTYELALAEALGGPPPVPPSSALRAYLAAHTRR